MQNPWEDIATSQSSHRFAAQIHKTWVTKKTLGCEVSLKITRSAMLPDYLKKQTQIITGERSQRNLQNNFSKSMNNTAQTHKKARNQARMGNKNTQKSNSRNT